VPWRITRQQISEIFEAATDVGISDARWTTHELTFKVKGRPCRVEVAPVKRHKKAESERDRRHRLLFHYFKNVFAGARDGVFTAAEALIPFHVTDDGRMLSAVVLASDNADSEIALKLAPRALGPAPSGAIPLGPTR